MKFSFRPVQIDYSKFSVRILLLARSPIFWFGIYLITPEIGILICSRYFGHVADEAVKNIILYGLAIPGAGRLSLDFLFIARKQNELDPDNKEISSNLRISLIFAIVVILFTAWFWFQLLVLIGDRPIGFFYVPIIVMCLGVGFWNLRENCRLTYGRIEVILGLVITPLTIYISKGYKLVPFASLNQLALASAYLSSIYVVVRGLDNISHARKADPDVNSSKDLRKLASKVGDVFFNLFQKKVPEEMHQQSVREP